MSPLFLDLAWKSHYCLNTKLWDSIQLLSYQNSRCYCLQDIIANKNTKQKLKANHENSHKEINRVGIGKSR